MEVKMENAEAVIKTDKIDKNVIIKQISRFASVGVLNTLLDFGILNFLVSFVGFTAFFSLLGFKIVVANLISTFIAMVNSYFLNKYWTFGVKSKKNIAGQVGMFFAVSIVGLVINNIVFGFLFMSWTAPALLAHSILSIVGLGNIFKESFVVLNFAKAWGIAFGLIWNFIAYKKFVFKK